MITRLRSRSHRLRWKLTWSYTWVAALTFLVIETVLLILLLIALGFNPLQRDNQVFNDIVAPILTDDIRPIIAAHLRSQPVDTSQMQADLEQILGIEPFTAATSPFETEQFASVFVLDAQQNLLASTPQYKELPPDGRFFDPDLLTGGDILAPLISAAYAGDTSIDQPYDHFTPEARYLVYVDPLPDENGRFIRCSDRHHAHADTGGVVPDSNQRDRGWPARLCACGCADWHRCLAGAQHGN